MSGTTLDRVRAAMRTALNLNDADVQAIGREATPLDVPGWNSLAHVQLMLELEAAFGITFDADEIASLASVSAIVKTLEQRKR